MSDVTAAEVFLQLPKSLQDLLEAPENTSLQALREKLGFKGPEDCRNFDLILNLKELGIPASMADIARIKLITELAENEPEKDSSPSPRPF